MKRVEAFIKTVAIDKIVCALNDIGVTEIIETEAKGIGNVATTKVLYRDREYEMSFTHLAKLEIVVPDCLLIPVVSVIARDKSVENIGEGRIVISPIEEKFEIEDESEDALIKWLQ